MSSPLPGASYKPMLLHNDLHMRMHNSIYSGCKFDYDRLRQVENNGERRSHYVTLISTQVLQIVNFNGLYLFCGQGPNIVKNELSSNCLILCKIEIRYGVCHIMVIELCLCYGSTNLSDPPCCTHPALIVPCGTRLLPGFHWSSRTLNRLWLEQPKI
jgi:hypothetical protein